MNKICFVCNGSFPRHKVNSDDICIDCYYDYPMTSEPEMVNHPVHYGGENNVYEAIKIIEAWKLDFYLGNAIKYILREKSDKIEDLEKAIWYINRRITQLQK